MALPTLPRPVGLGPALLIAERLTVKGQPSHLGNVGIRERLVLIDRKFPFRFLELPANPQVLKTSLSVDRSRAEIRGLGYEPTNHIRTRNMGIDLEFILDGERMKTTSQTGASMVTQAMAFLHSMMYSENPETWEFAASAPILTLKWPGVLSMDAVINDIDMDVELWTNEPTPLPRFVRVKLDIEEYRESNIFASDVLKYGLDRKGVGFRGSGLTNAVSLPGR